jgi:hypothetical protein
MKYAIIVGTDLYIREFTDIKHAKGWAINYLMTDGEVIIRPIKTVDITTRIEIK